MNMGGHQEERLQRAAEPARIAEERHRFYQGKIQITAKCAIHELNDFSYWYSPGVADPCLRIKADPALVNTYTNKANMVAVVSDGSRVLGLGDIGPEAGLPVMEGKALIFKYLGGVDAIPLCVSSHKAEEIIQFVKWIQPTFGGINLEDIAQPKCFEVLDRLTREAVIPVWHDDQQGTALVTLAGLINALELAEKSIADARIVLLGAGAANLAIARLLIAGGAVPGNLILFDTKGPLGLFRDDLQKTHPYKWRYCEITNSGQWRGDIASALKGADALIALSQPGPGIIQKSWISDMAKRSIVFACSNPTPEIWPWEAHEAGAFIVATGRSDFPNQVNNSLGFPAIFRGVLDVQARRITDTMCIAAARSLADYARHNGIRPDYIIPKMDEFPVFPAEAAAIACQAVADGVATITHLSFNELYQQAYRTIKKAQDSVQALMDRHLILSM